jgi:rubrerythrin
MQTETLIGILDRAIRAEAEASEFYSSAAKVTHDAGGRGMFLELADFEDHHHRHLELLRASLAEKGEFIAYPARGLERGAESKTSRAAVGPHDDSLAALRTAIEAEKKAETQYREIAGKIADDAGKAMFLRLAEEETMHRRVLDDQYYALTNRGEWVWGD